MEYVKLGTIIDTFSLDGTLKVFSCSNLKEARYQKGKKIYLSNNEKDYQEYEVISFRTTGQLDFVKVKEIDNPEVAIAKKNYQIYAIKDDITLSKDVYFFSDLEKCKVIDQNGQELGNVIRVEEFPAQITLRIKKKDNTTFFVPYVKEFIKDVDIDNYVITINVIEGLL